MDMTEAFTPARLAESRTRRLLVRMNATLFHCIGTVVLLESAAAATRAAEGVDPADIRRDAARIEELREYAKAVWPEFDWDAAGRSALACRAGVRSGWIGSAAGCAVDAYVPRAYDALLHIVEDPGLRSVMAPVVAMRTRRHEATARPTSRATAAWCAIATAAPRAQQAGARALRSTFDMLQHHWLDTPPFPVLDYGAAVARAWTLLADHLALAWSDRLLLRMWLRSAVRGNAIPLRAARPTDVQAMGNLAGTAEYALPRAGMLR